MRTATALRLLAGLGLAALVVAPSQAQYNLSWYTFDGGGGMFSIAGGFELGGTIGQPDANTATLTGGGFVLTGGFWAVHLTRCPGDCDCSGFVNFNDINPFVEILSGGIPCSFENADVDGSGVINFADINPFVDVLATSGGACP